MQVLEMHSKGSALAVAFSLDGTYLETNCSVLRLDGDEYFLTSNQLRSASKLLLNDNWLALNGYNMLRLPLDWRPKCSAIHGSIVAIDCLSGQEVWIKFNLERTT